MITSKHLITSLVSKKHLGCTDAICSVRSVVEKFVSNGSTVNVCTLDLSKAFDRMHHYALLIKLMAGQLPIQLLLFRAMVQYSVNTCVKCNGHVSNIYLPNALAALDRLQN